MNGVNWGLRDALHLVEIRAPFSLKLSELENVSRGGKAPDLKTLIAAACDVTLFEDGDIYNGLGKSGIKRHRRVNEGGISGLRTVLLVRRPPRGRRHFRLARFRRRPGNAS
jgi:uncharacterized linocin/CFP29 family protein